MHGAHRTSNHYSLIIANISFLSRIYYKKTTKLPPRKPALLLRGDLLFAQFLKELLQQGLGLRLIEAPVNIRPVAVRQGEQIQSGAAAAARSSSAP